MILLFILAGLGLTIWANIADAPHHTAQVAGCALLVILYAMVRGISTTRAKDPAALSLYADSTQFLGFVYSLSAIALSLFQNKNLELPELLVMAIPKFSVSLLGLILMLVLKENAILMARRTAQPERKCVDEIVALTTALQGTQPYLQNFIVQLYDAAEKSKSLSSEMDAFKDKSRDLAASVCEREQALKDMVIEVLREGRSKDSAELERVVHQALRQKRPTRAFSSSPGGLFQRFFGWIKAAR